MKVKPIVANIASTQVSAAQAYQELLRLNLLMDVGWIVTYGSEEKREVIKYCP